MTDHAAAVQAAAVDRALAADDSSVARRHLALVAAVDHLRGTSGGTDRLATAAAALLAVRATGGPTTVAHLEPPTPPSPGDPSPRTGSTHRLAVDGAAVAHRRFGAPVGRLADCAGVPRAAVRSALARR